jgi:PAS domain S-box-containing protein
MLTGKNNCSRIAACKRKMSTLLAKLNVTQKGLVLVIVPAIFEIIFVLVLTNHLHQAQSTIARIDHDRTVLSKLQNAQIVLTRAFMLGAGPEKRKQYTAADLQPLDDAVATFRSSESLTGFPLETTPAKKELIEEVLSLGPPAAKFADQAKAIFRKPQHLQQDKITYFDKGFLLSFVMQLDSINKHLEEWQAEEDTLEPATLNLISFDILGLLVGGTLLCLTLCAVLVKVFTTDILHRLDGIAENARRIAATKSLLPLQKGDDEIAALDRVIHQSNAYLTNARQQELAIIDNAAEVVCVLDPRLRFVEANQASAKVWGYSPDDLRGRSLLSMVNENEVDDIRASFQSYSGDNARRKGEVQTAMRTAKGASGYFAWNLQWVPDKSGFFCVVRDVTEVRKMELLKRQFISIVSHDLRTPLTSIGMSIALLLSGKRGAVPSQAGQLLENADRSMTRLMALAEDLLELDRLEAGKQILSLSCVHAYNVIAGAREALQQMAQAAQVEIRGPDGDALMLGEERRLVQVAINLLSNSIKFSPANSLVSISILQTDDMVEVRIADQGPGMTSDDKALVFKKFQATRTKSNVAIKSSGLGLAIVKAIVEAHHGDVGVESKLGAGSTFWFRIPRYRGDDEEEALE